MISPLPEIALSVRQPWAWFIVQGYKPEENRTWPTYHRGPVLIHASAGMTRAEYNDAIEFARRKAGFVGTVPAFAELERGGIVGTASLIDCIQWDFPRNAPPPGASPWFTGPFGHVFADAVPLPFVPLPGRLGYFRTLPGGGSPPLRLELGPAAPAADLVQPVLFNLEPRE